MEEEENNQLAFLDVLHGVAAEDSRPSRNFLVRDPVLIPQPYYPPETIKAEMIEFARFFLADCRGPRAIQQRRPDDSVAHPDFGVEMEIVAIPYWDLQRAKGLAGFGDPMGNLVVDFDAAGGCGT
ncbi:hypothetical protein SprV_0301307200 [Sparganum proliferum]